MKTWITKKSVPTKSLCIKQDIQLVELLEIIKDQLDGVAAERNNDIVVAVDPDVLVFADYDRLTQILINITKNSIQFTENGTIYLRGYMSDNELCHRN